MTYDLYFETSNHSIMQGYNFRMIDGFHVEKCYDDVFSVCYLEDAKQIQQAKELIKKYFGDVEITLEGEIPKNGCLQGIAVSYIYTTKIGKFSKVKKHSSKTMRSLETKATALEIIVDDVFKVIYDLRQDFKRMNQHRHMHMKGIHDEHTKYNKSIKCHIEALERIMRDKLKEIKEFESYRYKKHCELQTVYSYIDMESDVIADAEISYWEVVNGD